MQKLLFWMQKAKDFSICVAQILVLARVCKATEQNQSLIHVGGQLLLDVVILPAKNLGHLSKGKNVQDWCSFLSFKLTRFKKANSLCFKVVPCAT